MLKNINEEKQLARRHKCHMYCWMKLIKSGALLDEPVKIVCLVRDGSVIETVVDRATSWMIQSASENLHKWDTEPECIAEYQSVHSN